MAIILEGCDAVGKSTFAQKLAEKTGFEVVKGSSFEISELGADGMFAHMMNLLDRSDIIIDRFFYSNLVYGKLFEYPMMNPIQYDMLVEKMDMNGILVYLHASKGTIQHRMENRGDDMIKVENISDILEGYKDVLYGDFRPATTICLDTTDIDMDRESDVISALHKMKQI